MTRQRAATLLCNKNCLHVRWTALQFARCGTSPRATHGSRKFRAYPRNAICESLSCNPGILCAFAGRGCRPLERACGHHPHTTLDHRSRLLETGSVIGSQACRSAVADRRRRGQELRFALHAPRIPWPGGHPHPTAGSLGRRGPSARQLAESESGRNVLVVFGLNLRLGVRGSPMRSGGRSGVAIRQARSGSDSRCTVETPPGRSRRWGGVLPLNSP